MTTTGTAPVTTASAPGLHVTAHIVAVPDPRGGTALPVLHGRRALIPRHIPAAGPFARVLLTSSMSAPHGGDRLRLRAEVRTGARLSLGTVGATLALPGPSGATATSDVHLRVDDDAELHYLPEPLISAAHSDLEATTRVELAPGARLVLREEQILGRANEPTGRLRTRLTVCLAGNPLLVQELTVGPGTPSWSGPAVLADYRMTGQLLVVSPEFTHQQPPAQALPTEPGEEGEAVLTPLAGPAVLITAAATNHATLRQLLNRGRKAITP
ncbi:urease accessory protein UreD [Streptomyces sp. bgisy084]|uniref:urease accessory protein UreD n=1 Tax=unclassified Streptomyces TaxID=2593676 RepID=UPI003D759919